MSSPVQRKVGAIFIPVKDIEFARNWYSKLLGIVPDGEIIGGHLYVIPIEGGTNIVLDSKIYSKRVIRDEPLFHFNTENIEEAYQFMREKGIHIIGDIEHGHYFNFKDPDGNVMMVSRC
ncbi:VOC family protein [Cytobacillus suaedae]|nr:VOC family protein [Cytobacillus suaedae]